MMARTPDQQQLALECLHLAQQASPPCTDLAFVLRVANAFYAFVAGEPGETPRERINAALDDADVR